MTVDNDMNEWMEHMAIRNLLDCYTVAINDRDWALFATLFCEEAIWEASGPFSLRFEGGRHIAASIEGMISEMDVLIQTNSACVIELKDTGASVRSIVQETGRQANSGAGMRSAGTYFDDLIKDSDGWKFKRRCFRCRYLEETAVLGQVF